MTPPMNIHAVTPRGCLLIAFATQAAVKLSKSPLQSEAA